MSRRRRQAHGQPVNMTPMIDVTFLLLVFFIVTLNFKTLEGRLDAALPKELGTGNRAAEEIEKVDVQVFVAEPGTLVPDPAAEGQFLHDGRRLRYEVGAHRFRSLDALARHLAEYERDVPVTLDLKGGTLQADAIALLDRVVALDFERITFAGAPPERR